MGLLENVVRRQDTPYCTEHGAADCPSISAKMIRRLGSSSVKLPFEIAFFETGKSSHAVQEFKLWRQTNRHPKPGVFPSSLLHGSCRVDCST